jgi:hypothetical protein
MNGPFKVIWRRRLIEKDLAEYVVSAMESGEALLAVTKACMRSINSSNLIRQRRENLATNSSGFLSCRLCRSFMKFTKKSGSSVFWGYESMDRENRRICRFSKEISSILNPAFLKSSRFSSLFLHVPLFL